KLYKSIIEDVIEAARELFAEEGIEEQVLTDLKQLWETKVMQSKAMEGIFRCSRHSPLVTLQLPHNFHHVLQASAGQMLLNTTDATVKYYFLTMLLCIQGASQAGATLALPSGIAYPVHVPAGVMLQMASGHLYKVNVPVVVTQTPQDASILHHPVQQIFQSLGQPSVLQANTAGAVQVKVSAAPAVVETLQPQNTTAQQTVVFQPKEKAHVENTVGATLVQQPSVCQQQLAPSGVLNPHGDSRENSSCGSLHPAVFTPETSKGFSPAGSLVNNSSNVLLDVEGQLDVKAPESAPQLVSDIIDLVVMGKSLDDAAVLKDEGSTASSKRMEPTEQMESNLRLEKDICGDIEGIIQLDGTVDVSPKEEILPTDDGDNNEFIGIIESEDLRVLEDEDEEDDDDECDSISNTESHSSGGDNEEPQIDVVEEDPLNSGDDVSEQDTPDLFDTDNVIVCQYEKIHRSKNKWKFFLKDGVMSLEGRDHIFAKAVGDAEW
ncbi:TF2AY factor, partial [Centropus unirufus]|nr:TF2AY factor [Centropus unirufus]